LVSMLVENRGGNVGGNSSIRNKGNANSSRSIKKKSRLASNEKEGSKKRLSDFINNSLLLSSQLPEFNSVGQENSNG
jgi:hypothetical protein